MFQYWSYNTYGYLDFSKWQMFEWVDVKMGASDGHQRGLSARAAYDATVAKGHDLSGFDAFVVLMMPGQGIEPNPKAGPAGQPPTLSYDFDGGATSMPNDGRAAAVLPVMTSDFTFMCHEVGHTLGFEHTYGLLNNGADWDQTDANYAEGNVYGDPYDIMSSAAFGSRWENSAETHYNGSPTFTGPTVASWPFSGAFGMGPAPARAHVHLWDTNAIPHDVLTKVAMPQGGGTKKARLFRSSPGRPQLQALAMIDPPNEGAAGQGRIYIEYRDAGGWDAGLKTSGTDLSRQAVVVHALADAKDDGTRCWYRGRILIPLETDGDLAVPDVPLAIKVVAVSADLDYVDLELVETAARSVQITQTPSDKQVAALNETVRHTPCGDIHSGTYELERTSVLAPLTYGYGGYGAPDVTSPVITWTVGGLQIAAGSSTVKVTAIEGRQVTVQAQLNADTGVLTLISKAADGAYTVDLICKATEPGGSDAQTATDEFSPVGSYTGVKHEDAFMLRLCLDRLLRIVRLRPRDLLIPPGPDPYRDGVINEANLTRIQKAVSTLDERSAATTGKDLLQVAHLVFAPGIRPQKVGGGAIATP